jgi:hypothetical protein
MLYFLSVCAFVVLSVVNADVYFEEKFLDGRYCNCYITHLCMTYSLFSGHSSPRMYRSRNILLCYVLPRLDVHKYKH